MRHARNLPPSLRWSVTISAQLQRLYCASLRLPRAGATREQPARAGGVLTTSGIAPAGQRPRPTHGERPPRREELFSRDAMLGLCIASAKKATTRQAAGRHNSNRVHR
jgi:hypothetical protein